MRAWRHALSALGRQWRTWAGVSLALAGALAFAGLWLWTPVSRASLLALQGAYLLASAACVVRALVQARRGFAPAGVAWGRLWRRGEFLAAVALFAAGGVWLPARLAAWVPRFESLAAQAASVAVRLAAAWLLFTGGLCWLAACAGVLSSEDVKWKENSGFPTEKSSGL